MKTFFFNLVIILMLNLSPKAVTIYDGDADAFVLIEESVHRDSSYRPIGTGLLVAATDCYDDEIFLISKPEYFDGRDSIFVNLAHIELYSYRGIFPVQLTGDDKDLWMTYTIGNVNISAVRIPLIDGMVWAIDTAYSKPLSMILQGDDAVFLEFIANEIKTPEENYYPFARNAIVSRLPFRNTIHTEEKWELIDKTFIIDGKINPGSICSPVFSLANDSSRTLNCIGMIQGPYQEPGIDKDLGIVVPMDAIIKLIGYFHRCR